MLGTSPWLSWLAVLRGVPAGLAADIATLHCRGRLTAQQSQLFGVMSIGGATGAGATTRNIQGRTDRHNKMRER